MYKFYYLEDMTQEDLNNLALERNTLQQENKQLKDKINTYENPEDLTLMFMYCDEKAKDKIKQLKADLTKEKLAYSNLRDTYNKKYDECKLYKEVIEEVRGKLKLERKIALSLKHPYTVSNIDEVLQILDKVK